LQKLFDFKRPGYYYGSRSYSYRGEPSQSANGDSGESLPAD
jgi:hypothetical protein